LPPNDCESIAKLYESCGCLEISSKGELCFLRAITSNGSGQVAYGDPDLDLDQLVRSTIGIESGGVDKVVHQYFETVHRWLPIVDKSVCSNAMKRLREDTGRSCDDHFPLLILCMALVTQSRCVAFRHVPEENSLYLLTRRLFLISQTLQPSLAMLQAGLLIVTYACGHGLEKSSYVTLASCVALARVMGYDQDLAGSLNAGQDDLADPTVLCWSAIVLLDRCVPRDFNLVAIPPTNSPLSLKDDRAR
jgi:hypothetical protein